MARLGDLGLTSTAWAALNNGQILHHEPCGRAQFRVPKRTLRKQNGFKDEITFCGPGGIDVTAISLWDNKGSADTLQHQYLPRSVEDHGEIYRWNAQGSDR